MFPSYAELHCLTNFSFLRGASHPEELVERAAKLKYSALAITDELFQARRGDREHAARMHAMAEDLARLLPPSKRGRRTTGPHSLNG